MQNKKNNKIPESRTMCHDTHESQVEGLDMYDEFEFEV